MERWTRLVVRFRWPILAGWLVVLLAGGFASTKLSSLLSNTFTVPGTDSERARTILERTYGDRSDGVFTVVFRVTDSRDRRARVRLQATMERAATEVPSGRARALRQTRTDSPLMRAAGCWTLDTGSWSPRRRGRETPRGVNPRPAARVRRR